MPAEGRRGGRRPVRGPRAPARGRRCPRTPSRAACRGLSARSRSSSRSATSASSSSPRGAAVRAGREVVLGDAEAAAELAEELEGGDAVAGLDARDVGRRAAREGELPLAQTGPFARARRRLPTAFGSSTWVDFCRGIEPIIESCCQPSGPGAVNVGTTKGRLHEDSSWLFFALRLGLFAALVGRNALGGSVGRSNGVAGNFHPATLFSLAIRPFGSWQATPRSGRVVARAPARAC